MQTLTIRSCPTSILNTIDFSQHRNLTTIILDDVCIDSLKPFLHLSLRLFAFQVEILSEDIVHDLNSFDLSLTSLRIDFEEIHRHALQQLHLTSLQFIDFQSLDHFDDPTIDLYLTDFVHAQLPNMTSLSLWGMNCFTPFTSDWNQLCRLCLNYCAFDWNKSFQPWCLTHFIVTCPELVKDGGLFATVGSCLLHLGINQYVLPLSLHPQFFSSFCSLTTLSLFVNHDFTHAKLLLLCEQLSSTLTSLDLPGKYHYKNIQPLLLLLNLRSLNLDVFSFSNAMMNVLHRMLSIHSLEIWSSFSPSDNVNWLLLKELTHLQCARIPGFVCLFVFFSFLENSFFFSTFFQEWI